MKQIIFFARRLFGGLKKWHAKYKSEFIDKAMPKMTDAFFVIIGASNLILFFYCQTIRLQEIIRAKKVLVIYEVLFFWLIKICHHRKKLWKKKDRGC